MLKQRQPKGLTPASLQILPLCGRRVDDAPTLNTPLFISLTFALSAWCIMPTHADTVYRCGEAYSTSSQCGNTAATEVKPSSVLHATGQDKSNTATSDLRDAQALERQRLQAERQAAQTAPVRVSAPNTPQPIPTNNESLAPNGKRQGKHARKPASLYFTAVANAAPKKKSTAKAVPPVSSP
jgi:hypothetical protein